MDIGRVERLFERYGERFVRRVFTEEEIRYAGGSPRTSERLAGRFAVKEAVLKGLGTGKSRGILWKDVETVRGAMGKPEVRLYGQASNHLKKMGGSKVHVSISHDGGKAIALVVIETAGGQR